MSKSIVLVLLELQQARCCDHCPGESIPVPKHSVGEEPFPYVLMSNLNLPSHLDSILSGPISGDQREKLSTCPFTPCREEAVDCNEVSPQPPLLQAEIYII